MHGGALIALQVVDLAAGGALLAYLAGAPAGGGAAPSSRAWWAAHTLAERPHAWIIGAGVALRGAVSLALHASTRSFCDVAAPVWVVVASLMTAIAATVELVQWTHGHAPPADPAGVAAAARLAQSSAFAVAGLCVAALVQEGLLWAQWRQRARGPTRAQFGAASLRDSLLDAAAAGAEREDDIAPTPDARADGARGLSARATRIYALARPEWAGLSVGLLALVGSSLSSLLIPKFFGNLVNAVVARDARQLGVQTGRLVLILLAGALLTFVRAFLFNSAGERVVARLRGTLFARMLSQEAAFFDSAQSGELVSRLTSDCTKLQNAATSDLSLLLRSIAMVVLSIVLMAATQWQLTLVCLGVVPPMALAGVLYGRAIRTVSKSYQDAISRASDVSAETLGSLKTVRAFGAEPLQLAQYVRAVGDPDALPFGAALAAARAGARAPPSAYSLGVAKALYLALFVAGITAAFYVAIGAILWYGCELVLRGAAQLGELVSFVMYAVQIGASLGALASLFSAFMEAVGASERVFQIIERTPALVSILDAHSRGLVPAPPAAAADGSQAPRVEFARVHFAYATRLSEPVLRGLDLSVAAGTTVAIVGASGAGKSTVAALLMRFYEPTRGTVRIDGADLRQVDVRWLRAQVAMVAQEPVLFACSIADNIAYAARARAAAEARAADEGGAHAPAGALARCTEVAMDGELRARVQAAAARAHAAEFVAGFAEGYETLVGERGVRLSGGQKQRIAIARALLHDPPILLLDEATSALDAESEALVQAALEALVCDRTTIVIAHRLSTVVRADQIVCLAHGKVAGAGAHAQLVRACPEYAALVRRQLHTAADDGAQPLASAPAPAAIEAAAGAPAAAAAPAPA
ncbi:hypothetical protein KFE25_011576 [Diacronema lutheri]|uniref:Uncharacterized protein n=1 Tax=Diacronema lutheri TaxID=2081491 RepID=A0A8J6C8Q1_DIALT|nr:hypothetical protein KFE25_011576 [Diacronema lutheri]